MDDACRSSAVSCPCPTRTTTLPRLAPRCKSRSAACTACSSKATLSSRSERTSLTCTRAPSCRSSTLNHHGSMFQPGQFRQPSSTATATKSTEGRDVNERRWLQMLFLPISANTPCVSRSPSDTDMKSPDSAFTKECSRFPRRRHERRAAHAFALRELDRRTTLHERSRACFAIWPAVAYVSAQDLITHSTETRPTPPEAAWISTPCIDRSCA